MTFTTCGAVFGVVRSCYTAPARFYRGGPVVSIRYYFAPPGAAWYDGWNAFFPRSQELQTPETVIGEVTDQGGRVYDKGFRPAGLVGDHWHGTAEEFAGEAAYPGPLTWADVPLCTHAPQLAEGGILVGGYGAQGASVWFAEGGTLAGGAGLQGYPSVFAGVGGLLAGGAALQGAAAILAGYGGLLAGGAALQGAAAFVGSGGVRAGGTADQGDADYFVGYGGGLLGGKSSQGSGGVLVGAGGVLVGGKNGQGTGGVQLGSGGVLVGGKDGQGSSGVLLGSGGLLAGGKTPQGSGGVLAGRGGLLAGGKAPQGAFGVLAGQGGGLIGGLAPQGAFGVAVGKGGALLAAVAGKQGSLEVPSSAAKYDFDRGELTASGASGNVYNTATANSGAVTVQSNVSGCYAAAQLDTGVASASGQAGITQQLSLTLMQYVFANFSSITLEYRVQIPTLSTSGQRFSFRCGFMDAIGQGASEGVYFECVDNVNSGLWTLNTKKTSGGVGNTSSNAAVGPAAGVWTTLKIVVSGGTATFYVDGASVGSIATNLPTTNLTEGARILKAVGTTSRTALVDYVSAVAVF